MLVEKNKNFLCWMLTLKLANNLWLNGVFLSFPGDISSFPTRFIKKSYKFPSLDSGPGFSTASFCFFG